MELVLWECTCNSTHIRFFFHQAFTTDPHFLFVQSTDLQLLFKNLKFVSEHFTATMNTAKNESSPISDFRKLYT